MTAYNARHVIAGSQQNEVESQMSGTNYFAGTLEDVCH